jgi:light-regulated signal transduction histidine kinase (bacteriophytochrome)
MVTSFLELLSRRYKGKLDSDADEFIGFAVDGAERMRNQIDGLLAYSRVGSGPEQFEPTDLEVVLDRAVGDLGHVVAETGARITHDPLPTVTADPTQIAQLLENLIANAIKFRGESVPEVHISASGCSPSATTASGSTPTTATGFL